MTEIERIRKAYSKVADKMFDDGTISVDVYNILIGYGELVARELTNGRD